MKNRKSKNKRPKWTRLLRCFDDKGNPITFSNNWNYPGNYRFVYSDNGQILTGDFIVDNDGRIVYIGASKGSSSTSIGRRVDDFIRDYCKNYADWANGFLLKQVKGFNPENLYVQFLRIDSEPDEVIFESEQYYQQEYREKYGELPCAHKQDNSFAKKYSEIIKCNEALNLIFKTNIEEKDMTLNLESNKESVSSKSKLPKLNRMSIFTDSISKRMNLVRKFQEETLRRLQDEADYLDLGPAEIQFLESVMEEEDPQTLSQLKSIGWNFEEKKSKKKKKKKKKKNQKNSSSRSTRKPNGRIIPIADSVIFEKLKNYEGIQKLQNEVLVKYVKYISENASSFAKDLAAYNIITEMLPTEKDLKNCLKNPNHPAAKKLIELSNKRKLKLQRGA